MASVPSKRPAPGAYEDAVAEAKKRAAEARARIEAMRKNSALPGVASSNGAAGPPPPSSAMSGLSGLEAIKARLAAAKVKADAAKQAPPPDSAPPGRPPARGVPNFFYDRANDRVDSDGDGPGSAGVNMQLHPLLRSDAPKPVAKDDRKDKRFKKDEKKPEPTNPYLAEGPPAQTRKKRELKMTHDFNHRPALQAANEMRRKAALEAMKARIQASAAKAGIEDSVDTNCFQVSRPPAVEWWDDALMDPMLFNEHVTNLIVHPVLIDPAQEKFTATKQPVMYLTKKEQKKMRRIRRAEENKDKVTKIRLGLEPAPAPKVTHKNVMFVYGELAVSGPSAIEDMINKQMRERQEEHERANAERQLSKEERREKIEAQAAKNAAQGLYLTVFKVDLKGEQLLNKHRFLINKNAQEWNDLYGFALVTPNFTLVLVESGAKATDQFKKLMTRRIKWQAILQGNGEIVDKEAWQDVEDSTCKLVHEGQIRERKFKKWGGLREVDTEQKARDALAKAKLDNFWVMAKSLEKGTGT